MPTTIVVSNNTISSDKITSLVNDFKSGKGTLIADGKRNKIKNLFLNDLTISIKSFKKPHLLNKIIYTYFRKSKARRSYEFANKLIKRNIGTPKPIAFVEYNDGIGLLDSYYLCEHINADLTYRELVHDPNFPNWEIILRQFTAFSYDLHKNGIEFLDHSPGNTLIKKIDDSTYNFYLIDLNRMNFHQEEMPFELRMKNLSRLTPKKEMVAIMSDEYAKLSGESYQKVFETMWQYTDAFQQKFHRKKRLKKKLKFWKK